MSAKTYGILMRMIAVALAALIAVSIVLQAPFYIPLISVMIAMLIASICRRFVKDIMTDERSRHIYEKATAVSYRIYTIITALFVLVVFSFRSSLPLWVGIAGQTLAYSLCGLMLVHLASTNYYGRRL